MARVRLGLPGRVFSKVAVALRLCTRYLVSQSVSHRGHARTFQTRKASREAIPPLCWRTRQPSLNVRRRLSAFGRCGPSLQHALVLPRRKCTRYIGLTQHPLVPRPSLGETPARAPDGMSRLAAMDQAIHKLNVGHYTLDVKLHQLQERLGLLENRMAEAEDSVQQVATHCSDNRKEIGRLEGCVKGRRIGHKCFLVYLAYETYAGHFLSSQPDGGKRENCVAMTSDDGDWWDNYCDRRMFYLCEFEA
uniref:C-type lectin domain-containing protein n=1 Tax=Electrophorus electricus TaxID=8005 RepID=A0AAY5EHU2_ELEEL